jgi:hypothetical protein
MYFSRTIDAALAAWKNDPARKPLMIRGARQTGKTSAVEHLATSFRHFVTVDFERDASARAFFAGDFDIPAICAKLEMRYRTPILDGRTLLFFDEIQACPRAIEALRYFYESRPALHVAATGSLLEFAFREIGDFGVGRIRSLFLHPFSFAEFASAISENRLLDGARACAFDRPLDPALHERLLDLLKTFLVIGGMPAAVARYVQTRSLLAAQREQDDILVSLKADFGKYKKRVPPERIRSALASVVRQVGSKFTYTDAAAGLDYRKSKEATDLLSLASLILRVDASRANGVPLGGDIDPKRNKFLPLDTGLYLRESGLDVSAWIADAPGDFVNRGPLAELFTGLELAKSADPFAESPLYYWQREARGSNAEIDYLLQNGASVLPVEVKSGIRGSMQSLHLFLAEKKLSLALRVSRENFSSYGPVRVLPLYLAGDWARFVR